VLVRVASKRKKFRKFEKLKVRDMLLFNVSPPPPLTPPELK
jgi:hypothetical protein